MTPRRRPSSSRDRRATAVLAAVAGALAAAAVTATPRAAAAQACCVGTGLVTPARLRTFESGAVGAQMRARSVMGAFGGGGTYAASGADSRELGFEEDLFAALRLGSRVQVGLWAPFVQTSRQQGNLSGFGGGLGDVALNARFDAIDAGTHGRWPGVAVLGALSLPTGQPLDEGGADDLLSTSGTGTGSFEGSLGVAFEEIIGQGFVSLAGFAAKRSARSANGVEQTFALRLSGLLSGGYTFGHDVTVGAFASALRQGDNSDPNGPIANSATGLVTAGGAAALPFWQTWRLQATLFTDVPIAGWGRNQTVGYGGTIAVIRFWI
ncbi:MAG TPA: hypothetical protein VIF57_02220 [Polyangia bacterium]|jgi:hypothetical protein